MRPEMVENGVKFLRHPSVQTTPLSERVSFLEQKGMTKDEIQEAIERFQSGDDAGAAAAPAAAAASTASAYAQPQPQMMMHPQQHQQPMLSAPMAMAAAAPMQQLMRRSAYPPYIRVLWTISSLVGAASILGFMWNYAVQSGYIPWLRTPLMLTAGKVKEEEEENARKDEALMTGLTDMSAAIQAQTNELSKLCSSLDKKEQELATKHAISSQIATTLAKQTTNQAISELKAEISTLKALLVTKNAPKEAETKAAAATASPATASQPSAVAVSVPVVVAAPQPAIVARAEKVESVLKLIRTQNSMEQLKLAAGILTMYVKNLVENPDVPRYRRIAPGNANFKQKVEPLTHHDDLLKAIGFETNGLNMEWKWHTADRSNGEFDDNLALLRAVLKALQSLTAPSASSSLSLEEVAHESLEEYRLKKSSASSDSPSSAGSESASTLAPTHQTTSTPATGPKENDLNSFMARLEKKASNASSASDLPLKKAADKTEPVVPAVSTETLLEDEEEKPAAAAGSLSEDEEKLPASAIESASAGAGPAYPKSFNEVMELIQKGETVPGIKDIEEKVSVDSEAYLKSVTVSSTTEEDKEDGDEVVARAAVPAKPWEKMQA